MSKDWLENTVFYEIYPQSFNDTNADGIGDIKGIIEKLDYIKELGCDSIWMNPCFLSPFMDAGYDVADFYQVAPRYGTNEDLKHLFEAAHEKGMHILLDLVAGHTSTEHAWFKESMKPERNEYTDRYVWTDSIWGDTAGLNCLRGFSDRDGSAIVNFFSIQPALNYGFYEPEASWQQSMDAPGPQQTIQELENIIRFWLDMGADGFRVDMAGSLVKNDPGQKGTIALWQKIRKFMDEEYPDARLVSEWGEPEKALEAGFHMDFLLHFGPSHYLDLFREEHPFFSREGKGDLKDFTEKYLDNYHRTEGKGYICIPSGNHDMDRMARKLDQEEMKIAFVFLLTMPGIPFIYYGDEIGMKYVEGLHSKEGGFGRTGTRTPMQWNHDKNDGFSDGKAEDLYLPLDSDPDRPTVEDQMKDENSLWHTIQDLIELRKQTPALQASGHLTFENVDYPLMYSREKEGQKILMVLNPSAKDANVEIKHPINQVLFKIGKDMKEKDGVWIVPGESAFVLVAA